ncbi:MAG: S24 family peptidase [Bacteroidota bacterium]
MIHVHSDRIELNNRFKTVFRLLTIHGKIVKNHRKLSKSAFARKLKTKGHIIDKYLQGNRKITYAQAKRLCQEYGINEAFMFQGVGNPFQVTGPTFNGAFINHKTKEKAKVGNSQKPEGSKLSNILFTNIKAFASDALYMETGEHNELFHIPGLQGDFVAFNIAGNSMTPTVCHGDMVICVALSSLNEVEENEIYALVTENSIRVKRLRRIYNESGKLSHLKLISDNFIEHDPVVIQATEVRQIFKVEKRLTGLGERK